MKKLLLFALIICLSCCATPGRVCGGGSKRSVYLFHLQSENSFFKKNSC